MDSKLEIAKQVWVNSTGKQYSVDRHEGKKGKCDYLMITEHAGEKGQRRYRISVPLPMVPKLIEALQEASQ